MLELMLVKFELFSRSVPVEGNAAAAPYTCAVTRTDCDERDLGITYPQLRSPPLRPPKPPNRTHPF